MAEDCGAGAAQILGVLTAMFVFRFWVQSCRAFMVCVVNVVGSHALPGVLNLHASAETTETAETS